MNLPTIDECRTFLATINRGRVAIGLEPLEKLEFDACKPNCHCGCLSAVNVFLPAGYRVLSETVDAWRYSSRREAPEAMGLTPSSQWGYTLSRDILAVTDPFDACEDDPEALALLRQRMVEAGVV